ncbi:MAG: hypothetical protein U1F50_01055 [Rubrivivax sp.]
MRHVEEGMPPFKAALVGSREVGFTHPVDLQLADRGVHPDLLHAGRDRPAVPRSSRSSWGWRSSPRPSSR